MTPTARRPLGGRAAWHGRDLKRSRDWIRALDERALDEIEAALAAVRRRARPWQTLTREDFPLPTVGSAVAGVGRQLEDGVGIAKLTGLPVQRYTDAELRTILFGIGLHLGTPVSQSARHELLYDVRDDGPQAAAQRAQVAAARGDGSFLSSRARVHSTGVLRFHTDRADVVGLLCVRQAKSGGVNKLASSVAVHDAMLARRPDLVEVLFSDYPRSRWGEEDAGLSDHYALPIFGLCDGHFTSHYSRTYIEAAQKIPGVPVLTATQLEAIDLLHEIAEAQCFETTLAPGDMEFLNNHVVYHARTAYEDEAEAGRRRFLIRLWLSTPTSRPLPPGHEVLWGSVAPGAVRGGICQSPG